MENRLEIIFHIKNLLSRLEEVDMVGYARRGMPVVEVPDGWEPGRKHFANSSYHKETLHQEEELER